MKMQIDLPLEINKKIKLYTAQHELRTMQDSIIQILAEKFKLKEEDN